jgi:hypothetical protein
MRNHPHNFSVAMLLLDPLGGKETSGGRCSTSSWIGFLGGRPWLVVHPMDLLTKAGGLLGPLEAGVAVGTVALIKMATFGGKES